MSLQHSPSQPFDKNAAIHTMKKKIVFLNKTKTKKIWKHTCYTGLCEVIGVIDLKQFQCKYKSVLIGHVYWYNMVMLYKENKKTYIDDIIAGVFVCMI